MNRIRKILSGLLLWIGMMTISPAQVMAQGNDIAISQNFLLITILILIGFIILVLIVIVFSLQSTMRALKLEEARRKAEQKGVVEEEPGEIVAPLGETELAYLIKIKTTKIQNAPQKKLFCFIFRAV